MAREKLEVKVLVKVEVDVVVEDWKLILWRWPWTESESFVSSGAVEFPTGHFAVGLVDLETNIGSPG